MNTAKTGAQKPARSGAVSAARRAAFSILLAVERGQAHSDELLRGRNVAALSPVDRNLATTLVMGTLRWQIALDLQLQPLLKRPQGKLDQEVLIALRLGAFQLLHLDRIPARAAIDESVELAKQAGHKFAAGMVNAVLRKLASAPAAEVATHPAWMVERWTRFYGAEAAQAICRHGQAQPVLAIRAADPAVEAELPGITLQPGELLTAARIVTVGDVTATEAFQQGRARIQDEGSQLIAEMASAALQTPAARILDACAAPGGKTLILAERHPQARIVACESSASRFEDLQHRLAYLGDRMECRLADASALAEEAAHDLVLADVPCSGTGTLGRNPEIRHRLQAADLERQAERQRAILGAAVRAVRPGGRVVYSTCSLEPEENEAVVAAVLAESPKARMVRIDALIAAMEREGSLTAGGAEQLQASITTEGGLRLVPGRFKTDGFFVAVIERV